MDDQQMDQWFGDKLRQEQEFDFRESDWAAVADGLDQEEKQRRRLAWFWWPLGMMAVLVLGLVFWQQQRQINSLQEHLSELELTDTVRKTIVITDTIRNTITLEGDDSPPAQGVQRKTDDLASVSGPNLRTSSSKNTSIATTTKEIDKTSNALEAIQEKISSFNDVTQSFSNSSVVKDRAQLFAVDSLTEPAVFLGEGIKGEKVAGVAEGAEGEKLDVYLTELTHPLPDISEVIIRKNSVKKIRPSKQWKPKFELDIAAGLGKPKALSANLSNQGKLSTQMIGAGFSVQPIKHWWIRAGVSRQVVRYSTTETNTANAYADSQRSELEEILGQTGSNQAPGLLDGDISSLKDQRRYWQYELGLRYDWLNRKRWNLYFRGDILAKIKQQRKTDISAFDINNQYAGAGLANESISSSSRDFSITGFQVGLGGNYKLNQHWQLSLEGTTHINNNGTGLSTDLIPLWDIRLGAKYRF